MNNIPITVVRRLDAAVPKFKKILAKAKERDVNESDTVTVITDMLQEVFGFDKYSEITSEYSIQGAYCDIAVRAENKVEYLVEVKAIGLDLNDKHIKQAVNYASGEGIRWVVLTNGIKWEIYRVSVDSKVSSKKLFNFDFTEINPREKEHLDLLFLLCKKGVQKNLIDDYYEYRQSVNRYTLGALLLTDKVVATLRTELRKLKPGIKVSVDEIKSIVRGEVMKREVLESEAGIEANKQIVRLIKKQEREKAKAKASMEKIRSEETKDTNKL